MLPCYRVTVRRLASPKITSNLPSWTSLVSTRIKSRARSHRCRSSSLQGFRSGRRGWLVGCQVRGTCVMCKEYMCKYVESIYNQIYIYNHTYSHWHIIALRKANLFNHQSHWFPSKDRLNGLGCHLAMLLLAWPLALSTILDREGSWSTSQNWSLPCKGVVEKYEIADAFKKPQKCK